MCVKPLVGALQCTIARHRTTPAIFVPTIISPSRVYVLILVNGRSKNEVWLTTLATFEKGGRALRAIMEAQYLIQGSIDGSSYAILTGERGGPISCGVGGVNCD